eukprot:87524_1
MPLQKTYLSIEHKSTFGIIASNLSNIVYDPSGKFAFCAALHDIHIWSLSEKQKIATLIQPSNDSSNDIGTKPSLVTSLLLSPNNNQIISGHDDGTIKVWDYKLQKLLITFNGHNNRVTCLTFNYDYTKMASAGFDTDIIVWDMIAQRGLFRLRGHIKPITKIQFIQINHLLINNQNNKNNKNIKYTFDDDQDNEMLISSSRDTSLKLWELETQHCVQTIVGHKNEVWSFDISKNKQFIVSGGSDSEVYVWKIEPHIISDDDDNLSDSDDINDVNMFISDNENEQDMVVSSISSIRIRSLGTVSCAAMMGKKTRIVSIIYNEQNNLLFAQTNSSIIQLFYCRSNQEIKKRLQIRTQKEKKKSETSETSEIKEIKLQGTDYLIGLTPIRTTHKLCSIDISKTLISMKSLKIKKYVKDIKDKKNKNKNSDQDIILSNEDEENLEKLRKSLNKKSLTEHDVLLQQIVLCYVNNMIGIIYLPVPAVNNDLNFIKIEEWKQKYLPNYIELNKIYWEGHRTSVRSINFSSDDSMIVSTCKNELKIWNTRSMKCIRNLSCEYGLKCLFAPGNKHVIVATKQGNILIYDLILNELIQKIIGHEGEIYTLCLTSDGTGIVTGGSDNHIKIWKFNLKMINNIKQLCISLKKSIKMQDEVLCITCSNNGKYLAASLLDNTIQIFFFDTMKFYLTLYGHRLPVFGMDISSDSTILVSGSADKNIKIWGLNHGDCKKSLFAHSDSIIQCKFITDTHYFYSCSKDGLIKYWDADKFKKIQEISGHSAEIWCMDINSSGQLLVSSGGDRSFRMYLESNEPLFPLQEEQKELQLLFDRDLDRAENKPGVIEGSGLINDKIIGLSEKASKKTMNTIELGESLMEAIQLCDNDIEKRKYCIKNKQKYIMNGQLGIGNVKCVEEYMFYRLKAIRMSDLEEILIIPPFEYLQSLFYYLKYCIQNKQQSIEKMTRCLLFLVKYHHQQLLSSQDLKIQLKELKQIAVKNLTDYRNKIGYNVQAMNYIQDIIKNKAKYIAQTNRYKKHEIDNEKLYQTW